MGKDVIAIDCLTNHVDNRAAKMASNLFEMEEHYQFFGFSDVVLHLVYRGGFVHNSNAHIIDFPKQYSFIKSLSESGLNKIVVMSSMHEVGIYEGSINENTVCNPTTLYCISSCYEKHS